ncbi:unnamed protein product [Pseudo-nitzschia multistriata]|uniref:S-adenosyl-L-methionine-dependent methyltransferase n=1 Tax=Pseudo-nitzschia multistriata TaxID=183589 RepID=A0A448YYB9_9STRA|nr:unnamed protein product [Pseudo-nitzschia multistriata]
MADSSIRSNGVAATAAVATPLALWFVSSAALALLLSLPGCWADPSSRGKNSVHTHDAAYARLGVRPPDEHNRVLGRGGVLELPIARWSWRIHGRILPLLHLFEGGRDRRPPDVFVNLRVLWCKLLSSLDPESPAYEGRRSLPGKGSSGVWGGNSGDATDAVLFATYRMLPPCSIRWPLRYLGLWRFFPRWMHANIELRTAYLKGALRRVLAPSGASTTGPDRCCVVVLGGGYDPRGAVLSAGKGIERVYELDLPAVVDSKRRLLSRAGFCVEGEDAGGSGRARNGVSGTPRGVRLEGVDLNDDEAVDRVLDKIRRELADDPSSDPASGKPGVWRVVVVSEAVLMYLLPGKARRVLEGLAERFRGSDSESGFASASFVFADRLVPRRNTALDAAPTGSVVAAADSTAPSAGASSDAAVIDPRGTEESEVRQWLETSGWELRELLFKPGATRHLGIATAA